MLKKKIEMGAKQPSGSVSSSDVGKLPACASASPAPTIIYQSCKQSSNVVPHKAPDVIFQDHFVFSKALPRPRAADYGGLKLFVYELPSEYHVDLVEEMSAEAQGAGGNCDFMLTPCTESTWE